MGFTARQALAGVWHIRDAMGVCMTLLDGGERALLVDTGYGLEDVSAFVRTLTDRQISVLLTHHHYDHTLGARWFERAMLFPEDMVDFALYTGPAHRRRVLERALSEGLTPEGDALTAPIPTPAPLAEGPIALGNMTAHVLRCPGHTPGSAVVWVPERALLLTGDSWNPTTWLFFPEALPVREYRRNLARLLELPFAHVLCSHREELFPRAKLEAFAAALTDEALINARPVDIAPYEAIDTRQALLPEEQLLVFDWKKSGLAGR